MQVHTTGLLGAFQKWRQEYRRQMLDESTSHEMRSQHVAESRRFDFDFGLQFLQLARVIYWSLLRGLEFLSH